MMEHTHNGHNGRNGRLARVVGIEHDEPQILPGQGKLEGMTFDSNADIEAAVRSILRAVGEDPEREGLLQTPVRVAKMYAELTAGYHVDPTALINDAIFSVDYDE